MKDFSLDRLTRFINQFAKERRRRMEITMEELYLAFNAHFTEDMLECGAKYCYIHDELDKRMDKHCYSWDQRKNAYVRRRPYKPRAQRTVLYGQTTIYDFID